MSDKKKKPYLAKHTESPLPKRPVILKSDREPSKDAKEKVEKEKQPTILIKTREHSTPKDERPQSPKGVPTEIEILQPSKIAQNENKEKRIEKPVQPVRLMHEPVKLIDENMEFNLSAVEFLNDANTNYLVIGIIGLQGVGKSMILNIIAQNKSLDNICDTILTSHEFNIENKFDDNINSVKEQLEGLNFGDVPAVKKEDNCGFFKFKMQDLDQIERGVNCTKGIDMYVTEDRVILLDCQALWSPSLIAESHTNPITSRSANVVTIDCLQLASYLMAVSHVLIAVQDWFADYNFVRYIQTAEMLKPSLSSNIPSQESSESTNTGESNPHLLLLHNRCTLEDYTPQSVKCMQEFYSKAFQKSNLMLNSGMYLYSDTNKNGLNIDSVCKYYNTDVCGLPINLFLLPEIYEDYDNDHIYRGHPSFEIIAKRLRTMLLGVNRHQITNVPNLSEKGWIQFCSKAWDSIKKCTFFMEYERFLP